jgi:Protein of unknown function (DUF2867)
VNGLTGVNEAIRLALHQTHHADVPTRWSTAVWPDASRPLPTDPRWAGGSTYTDIRERRVAAPQDLLWSVIEGIGGEHGWYSFPLAWSVRGLLDRLVGGVGLRRALNPRVRGSSPWRRTGIEQAVSLHGYAALIFGCRVGVTGVRPFRKRRFLRDPLGRIGSGRVGWSGAADFDGLILDR